MARTAAALHILVRTEAKAREVLEKLEKGAKFDQLAKRFLPALQGVMVETWENLPRVPWLGRLIKQYSVAHYSSLMAQ